MKRMTYRESIFMAVSFSFGLLIAYSGSMQQWVIFGCFVMLYILTILILHRFMR